MSKFRKLFIIFQKNNDATRGQLYLQKKHQSVDLSANLVNKNLRDVRGSYLEEDLWLPRRPQHVRHLQSVSQLPRRRLPRRHLLRRRLPRRHLRRRRLPRRLLLSARLQRRLLQRRRLPRRHLLSARLLSASQLRRRSKFPLLHQKPRSLLGAGFLLWVKVKE
jgi:hypothetical protein